jgi:hypothetical protein
MVTECPYVAAGVTPGQGGREGRPQGEGAQMIGCHSLKECEMQSAETVLGILRERGSPPRRRSSESHILGNGSVWFGGGPRGKGFPSQGIPRRAAYPVTRKRVRRVRRGAAGKGTCAQQETSPCGLPCADQCVDQVPRPRTVDARGSSSCLDVDPGCLPRRGGRCDGGMGCGAVGA